MISKTCWLNIFFNKSAWRFDTWLSWSYYLALFGIVEFIIFFHPDFGTAVLYGLVLSAMMFIASESVFETLHREFPDTIAYAGGRKVYIVSPSTLWATLNTIRAILSDIKIKRVAGKIKKGTKIIIQGAENRDDPVIVVHW